MATDEEPPGPLDLTSSILSNDPTYGGEIVSVDTTRSYSSDFRPTLAAVATGSRLVVAPNYANGYTATGPAEFVGEAPASGSLEFLRLSTNARTSAFRRQHFPNISDRDWNDWRWQSRHRVRTLQQLEKMLCLSEEEHEALVQGGTMLPVGITPYYMSLVDADNPRQPLRAHRRADAQ